MFDDNKPSEIYAAIDLGTNNCRLLIVAVIDGKIFEIERFARIVRLGEGVTGNGVLSLQAMDRALDALRVCARKLSMYKLNGYRFVTTQACRSAENADLFIERIQREAYLNLEIISTEEEARLAFMGCATLAKNKNCPILLIDIGGGSTECVWGHFTKEQGFEIFEWFSLPCGVMTLAELFDSDMHQDHLYDLMISYVQEILTDSKSTPWNSDQFDSSGLQVICASGTITTLTAVSQGLDRYSRTEVDGINLSRDEMNDAINLIRSFDKQQRANHPCIGTDRADLMLPGCAILQAIADYWKIQEMTVADRGVREGIIHSLIHEDTLNEKTKTSQENQRPATINS